MVVEARQFDGSPENIRTLAAWITPPPGMHHGALVIPTLEGAHYASPGDWIIRGVQGEFYPCKPDIFAATYEAVAPAPARPVAPVWGGAMGDAGDYWA